MQHHTHLYQMCVRCLSDGSVSDGSVPDGNVSDGSVRWECQMGVYLEIVQKFGQSRPVSRAREAQQATGDGRHVVAYQIHRGDDAEGRDDTGGDTWRRLACRHPRL